MSVASSSSPMSALGMDLHMWSQYWHHLSGQLDIISMAIEMQ
eukprot:CAMPEP_0176123498 /NCGR_PEP_ID=MMETSP0120_2-20121206/62232_1 /TAXON_ID=160619 /ORGANISM="Kryptoperidinium foliaceum, Strain CCMP 1326" /LENGTH=41 /DNA_ID= /DNA_START= /DNA_END= /DNA_ORIENTATION=